MQASERRLALHSICYFLITFSCIFVLYFFLHTANQFILAFIKSQSYDTELLGILKIYLLIFPSTLVIYLPYIFIFSIAITVYLLHRTGFFRTYLVYGCKCKPLVIGALICSSLLTLTLHFLPQNLLKDLDHHVTQGIYYTQSIEHVDLLEPLSFNHYKEWIIYLPDLKKNEQTGRYFARIYKVKESFLRFIGEGYIRQTDNGIVQIEDAKGYVLNRKGKVIKQKTISSRSIFNPKQLKADFVKKSLARWKIFMASPELPFTNRANLAASSYKKRLHIIKSIQRYTLLFSPLIIYLYLLVFVFLIKKKYRGSQLNFLFGLAICWSTYLLLGPYLSERAHLQSYPFLYLYFIPISGILSLAVAYWHSEILSLGQQFSLYVSGLWQQKIPKFKLKTSSNRIFFSYIPLKSKFWKAKSRAYLLLFKKLCIFHIAIFLVIAYLIFIVRFYLHWQFNHGIDQFFWFFVSQCLSIPEMLLSNTPYILAILLPFCIYYLSENLLKNRYLSQGMTKPMLCTVLCFMLCLLGSGYLLRENYAYNWKALSRDIYADRVLHFNRSKTAVVMLSYGKFIRLSQDTTLFYRYASKKIDEYNMFNAVLIGGDTSSIDSAHNIIIKKDKLILREGYSFQEGAKKNTAFEEKSFTINASVIDFFAFSENIHDAKTSYLKQMLAHSKNWSSSQSKYLEKLYYLRIVPFLLFILLCMAYLIFFNRRIELSLSQTCLLSLGAMTSIIIGTWLNLAVII